MRNQFLTTVSYSTFIVLGGIRRLLLAVLLGAGVDFENFQPEMARCSFGVFSKFDRPWNKNWKSGISDSWNRNLFMFRTLYCELF